MKKLNLLKQNWELLVIFKNYLIYYVENFHILKNIIFIE